AGGTLEGGPDLGHRQQGAVIVETLQRARRAEFLEIFRRRVDVEVHRKELALDEVGLGRLAQTNGNVRLAHGEVELLVGSEQRDVDVRIEFSELAEPRREPMHTDAGGRRYPQIAVRALAAAGRLGARGFQFNEHVMRGAKKEFALLGENKAARMAMKQGTRKLLFERADLP